MADLKGTMQTAAPGRTLVPVKSFDPEGAEYDYETARRAGLKPSIDPDDDLPHWPSRDPETGMLLKGRTHPTFSKGVAVDEDLGYRLSKRAGRYYTTKE